MDRTELVIDISSYDPVIKPRELIDGGVQAVILKTGRGMSRDPRLEQNGALCARAGLTLLGYHWDDILHDPVEQAEWAVADLRRTGLPVKMLWADQEQWWLDWDAWHQANQGRLRWSEVPRSSPENISRHNEEYMKKLVSLMPGRAGVYTARWFVDSYADGIGNWIGDYTLWIAHYGRQPKSTKSMTWQDLKNDWLPDYSLKAPRGASPEKLVGHQFTGDACMLPGVYGTDGRPVPLDVSLFNKDFLNGLTSGVAIPEAPKPAGTPPDVPEATSSRCVVNVANLNVRQGPGIECDIVGLLKGRQEVVVTGRSGKWVQLDTGGWVYAAYLTPVGD